MERRDAVRLIGTLAAMPFIPRSAETAFAHGERAHLRVQHTGAGFRTFNGPQQAAVTEIAEMIMPRTDTPGATDVGVAQFMDFIMTEWATDEDRASFLRGLQDIDDRANARGGVIFVRLSADAKIELLQSLDLLRKDRTGAGYAFAQLKSLTAYGYFTSERVQKEVLKTRMFFTAFEPDVPV